MNWRQNYINYEALPQASEILVVDNASSAGSSAHSLLANDGLREDKPFAGLLTATGVGLNPIHVTGGAPCEQLNS